MIDTNLWGRGSLDIKRLTEIAARLERSRIELWVPEQVLLEWARHAADDAEAIAPIWKRAARAGQVSADVPVTSDPVAVAEVLAANVGGVTNVRILPMSGEAAIAGIKDQILGTGPGTVRGGTRTGAVDSSWVRDALRVVGRDARKLIFLTANRKDVLATTDAMGITPDWVRTTAENGLYSTLFSVSEADGRVVMLLAEHLFRLESGEDDDPHAIASSDWIEISDLRLTVEAYDRPYPLEVDSIQLGPGARLVGLRNVLILDGTSSDASDVYSATVEFDAVLHANVILYGHTIDNDGVVQMSTDVVHNTLITAPYVAEVQDLSISELAPTGPAVVSSAEMRADNPDGARRQVAEAVVSLAGVEADLDAIIEGAARLAGPSGVEVDVTLSDDAFGLDDWVLRFEVDGRPDDAVEIACLYDMDALSWAGRDSFEMRPPYYVSGASGEDAAEPYSAIRKVWRWLVGA